VLPEVFEPGAPELELLLPRLLLWPEREPLVPELLPGDELPWFGETLPLGAAPLPCEPKEEPRLDVLALELLPTVLDPAVPEFKELVRSWRRSLEPSPCVGEPVLLKAPAPLLPLLLPGEALDPLLL